MDAQLKHHPGRQQGFVLVVTLVILVVITLSSLAMMTTMRAGISASGNIAFRQAATRAADVGVQQALQATSTKLAANAAALINDVSESSYRSYAKHNGASSDCKKDGVADAFSPERYRFNDSSNNVVNDASGFPCATKLGTTQSGFSLFYVVHRMASGAGDCSTVSCMTTTVETSGTSSGGSMRSGSLILSSGESSFVFYRITIKVAGPRQNNRYVQAFVY